MDIQPDFTPEGEIPNIILKHLQSQYMATKEQPTSNKKNLLVPKPNRFSEVRKKATLTRATGKQWYSGIQQDLRLHITETPEGITTAIYSKSNKLWMAGPQITSSEFNNQTSFTKILEAVIRSPLGTKARGLAVIVHNITDYYLTPSTREPDSDGETEIMDSLKNKSFPTEELKSKDTEQGQILRWLPHKANDSSIVKLSKSQGDFLDTMPEEISGKPVFYAYRGSAYDSIILSYLLTQTENEIKINSEETETETEVKTDVWINVFYFDQITYAVFMNKTGEVTDIRPYPHQQTATPRNFATSIYTKLEEEETNARQIELRIFAMGSHPANNLVEQLKDSHPENFPKEINCQFFPTETEFSQYHVNHTTAEMLGSLIGQTGDWSSTRLDYMVYDLPELTATLLPKDKSLPESFRRISKINTLLDFTNRKTSAITQADIGFLLGGQFLMLIVVFALIGIAAYSGWNVYKTIASEEWKLDPAIAEESKLQSARVNEDVQTFKSWQGAFLPRSKGWQQLQLLSMLFPERTDAKVKTFNYKTEYKKDTKTWNRSWIIAGDAGEEANTKFRNMEINSKLPEELKKLTTIDWSIQNMLEEDSHLQIKKNTTPTAEELKKMEETAKNKTRPYTTFRYVSTLALDRESNTTSNSYNFTLTIQQEIGEKDPFTL